MRVTLDSQTKYAYIWLRTKGSADVAESLPLAEFADAAGVDTLQDLILDFDSKGRLLGIEVANAKKVLPQELLDKAERI